MEIPRHRFSNLSVAIDDQGLKQSATWMLDSVTATQLFSWDVYRLNNPLIQALGPPTPGYDAVFKVLSKVGIAKLIRYNTRHKQVPCDGTPTPLRVLGGPSAQVKNPDEADVVITIKRPDQEIFSKESGLLGIASHYACRGYWSVKHCGLPILRPTRTCPQIAAPAPGSNG